VLHSYFRFFLASFAVVRNKSMMTNSLLCILYLNTGVDKFHSTRQHYYTYSIYKAELMLDDDDPYVQSELLRREMIALKAADADDDKKKDNTKWTELHMKLAEQRRELNVHLS
jgi:hypothetical protein